MATEIADCIPTQNQPGEKQQEAEDVKSTRIPHSCAREEPDHLDTEPKAANDDSPKKHERAAIAGRRLRPRAASESEIKLGKSVDRSQHQRIRQSHCGFLQKRRVEKTDHV